MSIHTGCDSLGSILQEEREVPLLAACGRVLVTLRRLNNCLFNIVPIYLCGG